MSGPESNPLTYRERHTACTFDRLTELTPARLHRLALSFADLEQLWNAFAVGAASRAQARPPA